MKDGAWSILGVYVCVGVCVCGLAILRKGGIGVGADARSRQPAVHWRIISQINRRIGSGTVSVAEHSATESLPQ